MALSRLGRWAALGAPILLAAATAPSGATAETTGGGSAWVRAALRPTAAASSRRSPPAAVSSPSPAPRTWCRATRCGRRLRPRSTDRPRGACQRRPARAVRPRCRRRRPIAPACRRRSRPSAVSSPFLGSRPAMPSDTNRLGDILIRDRRSGRTGSSGLGQGGVRANGASGDALACTCERWHPVGRECSISGPSGALRGKPIGSPLVLREGERGLRAGSLRRRQGGRRGGRAGEVRAARRGRPSRPRSRQASTDLLPPAGPLVPAGCAGSPSPIAAKKRNAPRPACFAP